jgi:hypothetical protein
MSRLESSQNAMHGHQERRQRSCSVMNFEHSTETLCFLEHAPYERPP